jgi:MoxR-like ATPase
MEDYLPKREEKDALERVYAKGFIIMKEFKGTETYVVSEALLRSVNIAMALEKPLLIKGEPGTGKTMLAEAICQALQKKLYIWNVKSTTKAQDGLYVYDTVQRLYDSQFGGEGVDNIEKYIKLGKLGEAFSSDEQVILLIDEVDKADLEFPNDLLWELDKMEFYIPETGKTIKAKHRPIVIITSNAEKELPDAFLRRCIFHYIAFPDKELMKEIIAAHYGTLEEKLLEEVLLAFYSLREMQGIVKKPSTSELLDWIQALRIGGIAPERIAEDLPFAGVLLKKTEDLQTLEYKKSRSRNNVRW